MILSVSQLHDFLQDALKLEHMTIPPYLTAMYSLHESANDLARDIIRSVVLEEMLHMALVANVCNAVGGSPCLTRQGFLADYPAPLPRSEGDFEVSIQSFSPDAVKMFLKIERATAPQDDDDSFETIGRFYSAVQAGLRRLAAEIGEHQLFSGDPKRQIQPEHYYGPGEIVVVTDLESALEALETIKDQGEGDCHTIWDGDDFRFQEAREPAHFFRFQQLLAGRLYQTGDTPSTGPSGREIEVDWTAVYRCVENPKVSMYGEEPDLVSHAREFNHLYGDLLRLLERAFNGNPETLQSAAIRMRELGFRAVELLRQPLPCEPGLNAGPTFEYEAF